LIVGKSNFTRKMDFDEAAKLCKASDDEGFYKNFGMKG
jgi:hypothetical protein